MITLPYDTTWDILYFSPLTRTTTFHSLLPYLPYTLTSIYLLPTVYRDLSPSAPATVVYLDVALDEDLSRGRDRGVASEFEADELGGRAEVDICK